MLLLLLLLPIFFLLRCRCCCYKQIALYVFIPLWNAGMCCIFGSILAVLEDWSFSDGILYVFSNSLGLGTPLTEVVPETVGGAVVDIIVSAIALGFLAVFADYVVTLNPARIVRRKFRALTVSLGFIAPGENNNNKNNMGVIDDNNNNNNYRLDALSFEAEI